MATSKYHALLFDMDGLMVDTERLYIRANEVVAASYGKQVTMATMAKMMGRGTNESLRLFASELGINASAADLSLQRQGIMLQLIGSDLIAMPGLPEMLHFARSRLKLGLATGSTGRLMQEVLARLNLTNVFDITQSCDDVEFGKPHPEVYLRTCALLGVSPDQCIVLEDSANGVRSGNAAGCYVIAIPNDHTRHHDLSLANIIVKDLHEARTHVASMAGDSENASDSSPATLAPSRRTQA